jgi:hypothetical protein
MDDSEQLPDALVADSWAWLVQSKWRVLSYDFAVLISTEVDDHPTEMRLKHGST